MCLFFFFEDSGTCVSFGGRCDRAGEVNVFYVFIYPFFLSFSCACEEVMFIFLFCFLVYFHFVFFFVCGRRDRVDEETLMCFFSLKRLVAGEERRNEGQHVVGNELREKKSVYSRENGR